MTKWMWNIVQSIILAGLTAYLIFLLVSNRVLLYINVRFVPLVYLAVGLLILMLASGAVQMMRAVHNSADLPAGPAKMELVLLSFPLVLGVFIPANPLASAAIEARGLNFSDPQSISLGVNQTVTAPQDERTILDWYTMLADSTNELSPVENQASVIGFVYHDDRLAENQFFLNRFVVTCCAADAFPLGIIVEWPDRSSLPTDSWVHVTGEISRSTFEGSSIPLIIAASVETVNQPDQPYLFP